MTLALFAKDLTAFPVAWFSGAEYRDMRVKAHHFLRSTARVAFAGGIIFALYKGRQMGNKVTIPVIRFSIGLARVSYSVEPLALITNVYLILTAQSILRIFVYSLWLVGQVVNSFKLTQTFFSVAIRRDSLKVDPCLILANLALNKVPEAQMGTGLYLLMLGIFQLSAFTSARWNMQQAPTDWALKGILHVMIGLDCLGHFEKYSRGLEREEAARKNTFFDKAAARLEPVATWIATGQWA